MRSRTSDSNGATCTPRGTAYGVLQGYSNRTTIYGTLPFCRSPLRLL